MFSDIKCLNISAFNILHLRTCGVASYHPFTSVFKAAWTNNLPSSLSFLWKSDLTFNLLLFVIHQFHLLHLHRVIFIRILWGTCYGWQIIWLGIQLQFVQFAKRSPQHSRLHLNNSCTASSITTKNEFSDIARLPINTFLSVVSNNLEVQLFTLLKDGNPALDVKLSHRRQPLLSLLKFLREIELSFFYLNVSSIGEVVTEIAQDTVV